MIIGHSISDADGVIQAIDEPVARLLQRTQKQLTGISYTSITHPDDVARSLLRIASLQTNASSVQIRKRYIGGEGAIITLDVQVSRLGSGDTGHLVGTLSTVPSIDDLLDGDQLPHTLWRRAKDLLGIMRARDETLGADLFADHAWTMLLIVYVAEAEGRIASIAAVGDRLSLSRMTLSRWISVLQAKSMIEPVDPTLDAIQLTKTGIDSVERLLARHPAMEIS